VFPRIFTSLLAGLLLASAAVAQPAPPPRADVGASYTLISRDGRRAIAARVVNGVEMFPLDELARLFTFTVREDPAAGGIVITLPARNQTIVLSVAQGLASAAGRVISLPAAPVRDGRTWLVPVEFVSRALAPVSDTRLELRKPSRLIIAGDLRVPQVVARHEALGNAARVTLDVVPATPHSVVQEAGRIVVRFEADAIDAQLPGAVSRELVGAVRSGDAPASVAIDLGPRFGSFRASDAPSERGGARIVVDVFAPAADTTPAAPSPELPSPLPDFAPPGGLQTIVIDPGHGGDEEGAKGPGGTIEKDVTLAVARRLKAALEGRLGLRAILTRDADRTIRLDERAAVANNNKADLFISLHANASVRPSAAGAEVYYLSLEEYGEEAARTARGESEALPVFGGGTREIEVILWEMAQARYIEQSSTLASVVEAALRDRVPMGLRAIQQAPFRVLVGANMPAVLVEMGYISNPHEERALASEARQTAIVQALVDAIVRFRDRTGRKTGDELNHGAHGEYGGSHHGAHGGHGDSPRDLRDPRGDVQDHPRGPCDPRGDVQDHPRGPRDPRGGVPEPR
jgi:N-acetylmuramoyl-L-alanine amidase